MAKIQRWVITIDGKAHHLSYTRRLFSGTVTLEIDGEVFELPRDEREEPFILGDERAMLCIDRRGKASIRTREGLVAEWQGTPTEPT